MSEPIVVTHLLLRKADVEAQIANLSERLALACADHDAVVAAVRLFDPTFADRPASAYHEVRRRMKRSAAFALCRAALHSSPDPLDTRELALHIIRTQKWDEDDDRLRLAMTARFGAIMARMALRGVVSKVGTNRNATLWALAGARAGARPVLGSKLRSLS